MIIRNVVFLKLLFICEMRIMRSITMCAMYSIVMCVNAVVWMGCIMPGVSVFIKHSC